MHASTPSRFTGKERDNETGLDYFGARYYGSNMGRFLSPDEFSGGPVSAFSGLPATPGPLPYADITNPQSLNKYSYTLNDPLSMTDPDGHLPKWLDNVITRYVNWKKGPVPPPPAPPPAPKFKVDPTYKRNVPTPPPNSPLGTLIQCTQKCLPVPLYITSTNEKTPVHQEGTPHARGEAYDSQVPESQTENHLQCSANCGAGYAQNEYKNPSPHSTGTHDHVQTGPGLNGGKGDLPQPWTPRAEDNDE